MHIRNDVAMGVVHSLGCFGNLELSFVKSATTVNNNSYQPAKPQFFLTVYPCKPQFSI